MSVTAVQAPEFASSTLLADRFSTTLGRYRVAGTECECIFGTPGSDPELWEEFLAGAVRSYRKFGVERVLEYKSVRTGSSTSMFMAIVDGRERVVGGVRVQGPYGRTDQAHALVEWNGAEGTTELRRTIESRLADGIVEMKTGWVGDDVADRHTLASAIARTPLYAMALTGARYALCTVADHAVRRWCTTGARISTSVPPVAYPDARYRTVPIWWDRSSFRAHIDDDQARTLDDEWWQFTHSSDGRPGFLDSAA